MNEVSLQSSPKWLQLQEQAKARAIQFMHDPDLDQYAAEYIIGSLAQNTLRAYATDVKIFRFWCESRHIPYLPASAATVANFLAAQANQKPALKASTIERRIAAIRYVHRMADFDTIPTDSMIVKKTFRGIMRKKRIAPNQKEPTTNTIIQQMVEAIDDSTLTGLRDRALLLLGFAGAFRRSELVNIKVEDLHFLDQGMSIYVSKSKTDQLGQGDTVPILRGEVHCPIAAVQRWLVISGISCGFLFRRITKNQRLWPSHEDAQKPDLAPQTVAAIVKKYTGMIGLDSNIFSGHSLRHGFTTSSLSNGAPLEKVMVVTRHKDPKTTLNYFKDIKKFEGHAGKGLL